MSRSPSAAGLVVRGLCAEHSRRRILHDVDLTVAAGSRVAVLGASGSGKSTLLRVVAGFHRPVTGRVSLGGRDLDVALPGEAPRQVPARDRRVGIVPQDLALFPHLDVVGNIGFGLPRRARGPAVARMLALTELTGLEKRRPHQLSGGQQQRVALARALAAQPDLLLLDEPFAALDADLSARLRERLAGLLQATATTTVLVTHDPTDAVQFAETVVYLAAGRVVQAGTPRQLYDTPADLDVARAFGEANLVPARVAGEHADTTLGPVRLVVAARESVAGQRIRVMLRPDHISAGEHPREGARPGIVLATTFAPPHHRLVVDVPGTPEPVIAHSSFPSAVGAEVHLTATGPGHVLTEPVPATDQSAGLAGSAADRPKF